MRIKEISCTQYAGLQDRTIAFEDGVNVVFGKNESGKTTVASLIGDMLFQPVKIDGRSNSAAALEGRLFPADRRGEISSSKLAEGELVLSGAGGEYRLSKRWSRSGSKSSGSAMLRMPDGFLVNDEADIRTELSNVLQYGKGVYSELLMPNQHGSGSALAALLGEKGIKDDSTADMRRTVEKKLLDAYSLQFGKVSPAQIGKKIAEKIGAIEGKYWDYEQKMPSTTKPMQKGMGKIHEAFNAFRDAKKRADDKSQCEESCMTARKVFAEASLQYEAAKEAFDRFDKYYDLLRSKTHTEKELARLHDELEKSKDNKQKKERTEQVLNRLKRLRNERNDREDLDDLKSWDDLMTSVKKDMKILAGMKVTEGDVTEAEKLLRRIAEEKNMLCRMNLAARIKEFGEHHVEIRSALTGKSLRTDGDLCSIREAVVISVPGVVEIELSPADVDTEKVLSDISDAEGRVNAIFQKCGVSDFDGLKKMLDEKTRLRGKIKENSHATDINGKNPTLLREKCTALDSSKVREKSAILSEIQGIIGYEDLDITIAKNEALLSDDAYNVDFDETISNLEIEIQNMETQLENISDIPEDYSDITDPYKYKEKLTNDKDMCEQFKEKCAEQKTKAEAQLNQYGDEDLDAVVNECQSEFDRLCRELDRWKHIEKVFGVLKEEYDERPVDDLAERFADYLDELSAGHLDPDFSSNSELDVTLYNNDRKMSFDMLSEGTKDTVYLAFRLACIDTLFPEGGGVIVFDDPFTDMDAERTEKASRLVKKFAERHQVLFFTCREEYTELFPDANRIDM